jgi:hypothetical protein
MSRGSWLRQPPFVVAVFVVALLVVAALGNQHQQTNPAQGAASQERGQTIVGTQADAACDEACRDEERAEADLKAQQDMARYALWMAVLTGIGVTLLAATLRETRGAGYAASQILRETKRQADVAEASLADQRDTRRKELRAYISVEPMGVRFTSNRQHIFGQVRIVNVGRLPATEVATVVRFNKSVDANAKTFSFSSTDPRGNRVMQPSVGMVQGSGIYLPSGELQSIGHYYVWGGVYYRDGYGERRFTTFCHRYNNASQHKLRPGEQVIIGPDKARYHEYGNDAD